MSQSQNEYYKNIAEKLIEQLKAGTAPWQRPWAAGQPSIPHNPISGTRYKGGNTIALMVQAIDKGYSDSRWMTYEQAKSVGAQVRKGEKGTVLRFYRFTDEIPVVDPSGQPVRDADGKKVMQKVQLDSPKVCSFVVFNAEQVDGLGAPESAKTRSEWEINSRAENLLKASGARISFGGDRAYYNYQSDEIRLPPRESFLSDSGYYATALHEVGHWSGHKSRLDRDMRHPFGSAGYAKEELRAEIFSMMLGAEVGLGHDPEQHAAYVGSWIKVLQDDHRELFRAAADAEKMMGYVMELEKTQELEFSDDKRIESPDEAKLPAMELGAAVPATDETLNKTYLAVAYSERNEAKALGAKWDKDEKSWYIPAGEDASKFEKWLHKPTPQEEKLPTPVKAAAEKTFLAVPYLERFEAKKLGARWDGDKKSWYVQPGDDLQKFEKWLDKKVISPRLDPVEEFANALKEAGLILEGAPEMDGQLHRVPVVGGDYGSKDGAYTGHLDGRPAGFIQNFRTGHRENWKSQGYSLSESEKAKLHAEAAQNLEKRQKEREQAYESVSGEVSRVIKLMEKAQSDHPYLGSKGLAMDHGALYDKLDKSIVLPASDINGQVWSYQKIYGDGQKSFLAGGKISGCMFVATTSAWESVANGSQKVALQYALGRDRIYIAEGYATASTLAEALKTPVIAAFSSGNLEEVAKSIRSRAPNAEIVICGDDDRATELKRGKNPGKEKALAAAQVVNGRAVFPRFPPGKDQGTDFNDLQKVMGLDGVAVQLRFALAKTVERSPPREIKPSSMEMSL
jgi:antirestriction protein ArdC/phage/plasmid primase-like uncharacterized protein